MLKSFMHPDAVNEHNSSDAQLEVGADGELRVQAGGASP